MAAPASVVPVLVEDVPDAEPVAEPDAEPETEPDAFTSAPVLAGVVAVELEAACSVLVAWLVEVFAVASVDVSLVVLLLLFTSPEQPAPNVRARASNADEPIKPRYFFILNASIVVEKTARRSVGGRANLDPRS